MLDQSQDPFQGDIFINAGTTNLIKDDPALSGVNVPGKARHICVIP
jgi:hypothetical protein